MEEHDKRVTAMYNDCWKLYRDYTKSHDMRQFKPIKAVRLKMQSLSLPWTVSSQTCYRHCSVMAQKKLIQKIQIQNKKGKERMNDMTTFIASRIMEEADKSVEAGQKKYRAYFVKTRLYKRWKDNVDTILKTDGYEDVIVEA